MLARYVMMMETFRRVRREITIAKYFSCTARIHFAIRIACQNKASPLCNRPALILPSIRELFAVLDPIFPSYLLGYEHPCNFNRCKLILAGVTRYRNIEGFSGHTSRRSLFFSPQSHNLRVIGLRFSNFISSIRVSPTIHEDIGAFNVEELERREKKRRKEKRREERKKEKRREQKRRKKRREKRRREEKRKEKRR